MTVVEIPTIVVIIAMMESRCSSLRRRLLYAIRCHEFLKLLLFLTEVFEVAEGRAEFTTVAGGHGQPGQQQHHHTTVPSLHHRRDEEAGSSWGSRLKKRAPR